MGYIDFVTWNKSGFKGERMDLVESLDVSKDTDKGKFEVKKYEKSNKLITAKFNMSRMEQDIIAYCLSVVRGKHFSEEEMEKGIKVKMSVREIRDEILDGSERKSIYEDLLRVSEKLQAQTIMVESYDEKKKDKNEFILFPLVKTCSYKDGEFTLIFHENVSPMIIHKNQTPFTILDFTTFKSLNSNYAKRIYELLKLKSFTMTDGKYEWEVSLIELKLTIGVIDGEKDKVKRILEKYKNDPEAIEKHINMLDEGMSTTDKKKKRQVHKFKEWRDFRKYVIEVARKEMLQSCEKGISDIAFDYETITKGKKVVGIRFIVYEGSLYKLKHEAEPKQMSLFDVSDVIESISPDGKIDYEDVAKIVEDKGAREFFSEYNKYQYSIPAKITPIIEQTYKLILVEVVSDLFKETLEKPISSATAKNIAEAGEYDLLRIFRNIEYAIGNKRKIKDVQAYLVDACKRDYTNGQAPQKKEDKKVNTKGNAFLKFEHREYDFEEIEKTMLSN